MWSKMKPFLYATLSEVSFEVPTLLGFKFFCPWFSNDKRDWCSLGIVGLQAAVSKPEICRGLMLLNISLRMLHIKKQPLIGRPFIRSFQNLLR